MATVISTLAVPRIGDAAGEVWRVLDETGPVSMSKLLKLVETPRDVALQGIGWLAREDKIEIEETNRAKIVSLK